MILRKSAIIGAISGFCLLTGATSASAESIANALASAYTSNPQINSARAQTRVDDENVPIARAARLPVIELTNTSSFQKIDITPPSGDRTTFDNGIALSVTQNLFTGFRVTNSIRQSEAGVLASRELLRNTVQNVLFDAAQAYLDVIRDTAILDIRRNNVIFLDEQVRAANERFNVGENTRTDVAQARTAAAAARAAVALAEANLATSRATYRQVIGHDPAGLNGAFPYTRLIPRDVQRAVVIGQDEHPVILSAIHQADAQAFVVKQIEGERLPTVSVQGSVEHDDSFDTSTDPNSASILGRITIPLLPGNSVFPRIRQAKEQYGLLKIQIDFARDQVRAAVVTAWAQEAAAVGAIAAAQEGVEAAEIALSGVQEEQRVGQRTTLDVLDSQQDLLSARETLIVAIHDRTLASFAVLSAIGQLTAEALALPAVPYDPTEHYDAVRGRLLGSRTPDGR